MLSSTSLQRLPTRIVLNDALEKPNDEAETNFQWLPHGLRHDGNQPAFFYHRLDPPGNYVPSAKIVFQTWRFGWMIGKNPTAEWTRVHSNPTVNILHCPCTQKYEPDCGVILVAHGLARTPLFTDFVGPGLARARLLSVSRWTPIGPNPAIEWFSLQVDWPGCRCWMILVERAASAIRYIHWISNYEKKL